MTNYPSPISPSHTLLLPTLYLKQPYLSFVLRGTDVDHNDEQEISCRMGKKTSPEALTTSHHANGKGHVEVEEDDEDIYCGVGQCRPHFMQVRLE